MTAYAPQTQLERHEVTNVPPPLGARNLYAADAALRDAAAGPEEALQWGEDANRYPPELQTFDRFRRRIDEVKFHPAYRRLLALAMEHRIHSIGWAETRPGRHVVHDAKGAGGACGLSCRA